MIGKVIFIFIGFFYKIRLLIHPNLFQEERWRILMNAAIMLRTGIGSSFTPRKLLIFARRIEFLNFAENVIINFSFIRIFRFLCINLLKSGSNKSSDLDNINTNKRNLFLFPPVCGSRRGIGILSYYLMQKGCDVLMPMCAVLFRKLERGYFLKKYPDFANKKRLIFTLEMLGFKNSKNSGNFIIINIEDKESLFFMFRTFHKNKKINLIMVPVNPEGIKREMTAYNFFKAKLLLPSGILKIIKMLKTDIEIATTYISNNLFNAHVEIDKPVSTLAAGKNDYGKRVIQELLTSYESKVKEEPSVFLPFRLSWMWEGLSFNNSNNKDKLFSFYDRKRKEIIVLLNNGQIIKHRKR